MTINPFYIAAKTIRSNRSKIGVVSVFILSEMVNLNNDTLTASSNAIIPLVKIINKDIIYHSLQR